ncbi:MAG: pyruvate dehydrogenase complex dihydrolipoamide acetyltransferase [Alphaproteobacteria bacterium]|nr:pyruvate dehydrogenase complex dihydrolipoamide acetyltransferase [Alphaproteobacteria bacterium]|tara:strand:- start:332 stop:1567 length:1236 start_codon:yes stop_codon:yes gene_type:complete
MPISILMPALSPTMTEGNLARWLKAEGDTVASGDVIAEIETDKATMEVEAVDEGTLGKILVPEGAEDVAVNTPIAVLLEDGEDDSALDVFDTGGAPAPAEDAAPAAAEPEVPAAPAPAAPSGGRVFASPLARRLAQQQGIELSQVTGTGPNGRIVKADIESFTGAPAVASAPAAVAQATAGDAPFELAKPSNMRKVIAQRMTASKQNVPHFYLTMDCEIDRLLEARAAINARAKDGEFKISVNDMIIKACAAALTQVPRANAGWSEEGIRLYQRADISVAVAIDEGLVTPIVRGAEGKGLRQISAEMGDLAVRARDGSLMPEDYQGGTFTISNLGMYGVKNFDAVINEPQGAILAVGAGEQRPVVHDGELAVATVMSLTLSVDHRALDGAIGAEFLAALKSLIEQPVGMLL